MLCLCRAFSPSTRLVELGTTIDSLEQYLGQLRSESGALNTRHLIYMMYKPKYRDNIELKASDNWRRILQLICLGAGYHEIARDLSITHSGVVKILEKLKNDNNCYDTDELVILYADWEFPLKNENKNQAP